MAQSGSKSPQHRKASSKAGAKSPSRAPSTRAGRQSPQQGIIAEHAVDLVALALGTASVLCALAVWFGALGPVGRGLDHLLGILFGKVRYLVPLIAGAGVATLLVNREEAETTRLWFGGGLAVVALCGLAGLSGGNPAIAASTKALEGAGGYVGAISGHLPSRAIGTVGAVVVLVAAFAVSLVILTGIPLKTALPALGRGVRSISSFLGSWWAGGPLGSRPGPSDDLEETEPPEPKVSTQAEEARPREPVTLSIVPDEVPAEIVTPISKASSRKAKKAASPAPGNWSLPPLDLLRTTEVQRHDQRAVDLAGAELVTALAAHGVDTTLVGCTVGPTVTRYELELGPGVKVARVTSLSKDIAYAMASPDVRILAPIPGRSAIGVEVPNRQRQLVTLGDLLSSEEAMDTPHPLLVALGRDIAGRTVMQNLAEFPHVLISGATGAGKSSAINSLITSLLMRTTPDEVRLILVDPKRVELGQYNDLPHLLSPVVVDPKKAANALAWAVKEMERRYDLLAEHGVRDITSYHEALRAGTLTPPGPSDVHAETDVIVAKARAAAHGEPFDAEALEAGDPADGLDPLPFIVIVVDELNDLMMVAARDVEESVVRIAQMARAVGIHLCLATQRPSVDVITGVIKANVPSRMAFSVSSLADSRVILDQPGAERLVGKGDMLLLTASSNVARRIQAPWVSEEEVRAAVAFWRAQGGRSELTVAMTKGGPSAAADFEAVSTGSSGSDDDDELLRQAREQVVRSQLGSTSMLQRKLRVGFARAGRLMDLLEQEGVVGPSHGSKARAVLMTVEELDDLA